MEHHTFEPKNCEFNDKSKFAASNAVTVINITKHKEKNHLLFHQSETKGIYLKIPNSQIDWPSSRL